MGLTRDMMVLCKRIHVEILYSLVFVNVKDELILEHISQIDDYINESLELLRTKHTIAEDEKNELKQIAHDIKEVYQAINRNELNERIVELLQRIMTREKEVIRDEINEHEINMQLEMKLGEMHRSLEALMERSREFKYENSDDPSKQKQTLFDAVFKMETTNELLAKVNEMKQHYAQECRLMSAIEDLFKRIALGEVELHDLLEKVGIDPEHNHAELAHLPREQLIRLLMEAEVLAEDLEAQEEDA